MAILNAVGRLLLTGGTISKWITGGSASETLTGTGGNDWFYGGGGQNAYFGGAGDDVYSLGFQKNEKVVEAVDSGIDTISSWASFVLPANVENLKLASPGAWYGIGNGLDNIITGTDGAQQLEGAGGNDIMSGAAGADVFIFGAGDGRDLVTDFLRGTDKIRLADFGISSFDQLRPAMVQVGANTEIRFATGDRLTLANVAMASLKATDFQLGIDTASLARTFSDEFSSLSLQMNGGTWRTTYSNTYAPNPLMGHYHDGESQIYVDPTYAGTGKKALGLNPFSIDKGILTITAAPTPASMLSVLGTHSYTSGLLTTQGQFSQQYGYFEVRAKLPAGQGFWPAFWLLPADGSWPPEIDVFEVKGSDPTTMVSTSHRLTNNIHSHSSSMTYVDTTQWHTYGVDWTRGGVAYYVDGVKVAEQALPGGMNGEAYVLLNLAVGGEWNGPPDGTTGTGRMNIDYFRAYANADTVSVHVNGVAVPPPAPIHVPAPPPKATLVVPSLPVHQGTSGNDYIVAQAASGALVRAQGGNDSIVTGAGNDWIDGSAGNDVIRTMGGNDHILFGVGSGRDRIVDFDLHYDVIEITGYGREQMAVNISAGGLTISFGHDAITLAGVTSLSAVMEKALHFY